MTQHPEEGTLHAYIDGELSLAEAAALELHVGECARCGAALAEARGLVAAASRVITTLDAAPSSSAKAPIIAKPAAPVRRAVRPPIFRVPYARAAALLLLVGGTAFVVDRSGAFAGERSTQTESAMADAATGSEHAPIAPTAAATTTTSAPIRAPEAAAAADLSAAAGGGAAGNVRREPVAPRRVAAGITADGTGRALSAERSAEPSETDAAAFAQRGVAGGVATPAAPVIAQTSVLAGKDAPPEAAKARSIPAAPRPPSRADMRLEEVVVTGVSRPVTGVSRYRTREGAVLVLTEEPFRISFVEESTAARLRPLQDARQGAAFPASAPPTNSFRWSDPEKGSSYTLTGPLPVAELEALSKRLSELERLP